MNVPHSRWMLSVVSAAVLASLAACGGGSDSEPATPVPPVVTPPVAPTAAAVAQDDTASVTWNKATALDVTSNDTITNGTAALTVTAAPAHGTAVVDGTKITYTPATGYFGADTLKYMLTVGDKSAEANVQIAVGAQMTISGTVHDAVMPGAQVVATVGGVVVPAVTADSSGNYSVTINTTDPTDFISLVATGVGAQANVVLASLVGDAGTTAAAVSSTGTVDATALPSANVTNVSTAIAVLSQQALGKAPASSADLAAAQGQFTSSQTVQMATAIKLVADAGIALPDGSTDTLALVTNPDAFNAFVATQASTNSDLFNSTSQAVLSDPTLAIAAPVPAAGAPDQNYLLVIGQGASSNQATRLTLKAGNKAVIEADTVRTGTWSTDGAQITVTYDTPAVTEGNSSTFTSDGIQHTIQTTETGFKMRQISGTPGSGTATISSISSFQWLDGPYTGQVVVNDDSWLAESIVSTTQPLTAADFAVGARWSGMMSTDFSPVTSYYTMQDSTTVVDGSTMLFERSQQKAAYAITNGNLVITTTDGSVFTYSRLFTGPRGEERWVVEKTVAGAPVWIYETEMAKAQPGVSFTAAGLAARWESYINVGLAPEGKFYVELSADGSGRNISTDLDGTEYPTSDGTWVINADGTMTFTRMTCNSVAGLSSCTPYQIRTWQLIAVSGSRIYVMERLTFPGSGYDQYRTNVYTAPGG